MFIKYSEKIKQLHNEGKISFEQAKIIFEESQKTDKNEKFFLEQVFLQKHKRERSLWGVLIVWTILLVFCLSVLIFSGPSDRLDASTKKALKEIEFANFYLVRGDYEEAISLYEDCIEKYPDVEIVNVLQGLSYKLQFLELNDKKSLEAYVRIFHNVLESMTGKKNLKPNGKMNSFFILIFIVLFVSVFKLVSIFIYMVLVNKERKINKLWIQISIFLQRKIDFMPALIEGIIERAGNERGELKTVLVACLKGKEDLTEIGGLAIESSVEMRRTVGGESSMGYGFKNLGIFLERFPQLQSEKHVMALREQLQGIDNELYKIIEKYNLRVGKYNKLICRKPFEGLVNNFGFYRKSEFQKN